MSIWWPLLEEMADLRSGARRVQDKRGASFYTREQGSFQGLLVLLGSCYCPGASHHGGLGEAAMHCGSRSSWI